MARRTIATQCQRKRVSGKPPETKSAPPYNRRIVPAKLWPKTRPRRPIDVTARQTWDRTVAASRTLVYRKDKGERLKGGGRSQKDLSYPWLVL